MPIPKNSSQKIAIAEEFHLFMHLYFLHLRWLASYLLLNL